MKCDEAKPNCQRCTSTNRRCDGYAIQYITYCTLKSASVAPDLSISPFVEECRAFYFFRTKTGPQISGLYESDFWNRVILQAAHSHEVIRHAVIALGSLHECFEKGDITFNGTANFALKQYNMAMREHIKVLSQTNLHDSMETILATFIVFICIEVRKVKSDDTWRLIH